MAELAESLAQHHRYLDRLFASALEAADRSDWAAFTGELTALGGALDLHIDFEEDELFLAFEQASGLHDGPTRVMRIEHAQMRDLLHALSAAQPRVDPEGCRAELEHLRTILQMHNVKEETVFYPVCERLLGARDDLLAGARALNEWMPPATPP